MGKREVVYAFVDSQNLNLGVISQGWKLDFAKFRIFLADKYKVSKAYLFIGYIPERKSLYEYLEKSGFVIVFKPTVRRFNQLNKEETKGNVDAELVLHSMIQFNRYDKSIIVSGDGDFYCLVEYLEKKGKLLKIIAPNKKYSSLLKRFAKYIVLINSVKSKINKGEGNKKR